MIEYIGAVSSCPNARNVCHLSARISHYLLEFIHLDDTFSKSSVWDLSYLYEDAFDWEFCLYSINFILEP